MAVSRVLVGLDGSDLARRALRRAVDLVRSDCEITLVTVVAPPVRLVGLDEMPTAPSVAADVRLREQETATLVAEAEAGLAETARSLGLEVAIEVGTGDPGGVLCQLAEDGGYDLVVVGSHGSGLLKRVFLGSVSDHVLHHAPCPVLVVRDPSTDSE